MLNIDTLFILHVIKSIRARTFTTFEIVDDQTVSSVDLGMSHSVYGWCKSLEP